MLSAQGSSDTKQLQKVEFMAALSASKGCILSTREYLGERFEVDASVTEVMGMVQQFGLQDYRREVAN